MDNTLANVSSNSPNPQTSESLASDLSKNAHTITELPNDINSSPLSASTNSPQQPQPVYNISPVNVPSQKTPASTPPNLTSLDGTDPMTNSPQNRSSSKQVIDSSNVTKWDESQKAIDELEKDLQTKLIVLYISQRSALTEEDVDYIYNHVRLIGHTPKITLFLYGPGGSGIAATRIVYLLRQFTQVFHIIAPSIAASAMTMLSLGADKIFMGPLSSLSPIDTSIANHPLAPKDSKGNPVKIEVTQLQKFIDLINSGMTSKTVDDVHKSPYELLAQHVHPVVIGTIQRILSLSKMLTTDILKTHMKDEERINYIVNELNDKFPTHGYPITFDKAQSIQIQVEKMSDEINSKCLKFLKLLEYISKGGSKENEGIKVSYSRPVIIESKNLRSYYYQEKKFILDKDKKWLTTGIDGRYMIVAPSEDEKGIIRVKNVEMSDI